MSKSHECSSECVCPTVLILAGVSGSGKTTIGQRLSSELNYQYIEGDDYHTKENKDKMSNGMDHMIYKVIICIFYDH